MGRWQVILSGLIAGILTACALIGVGGWFILKGLSHTAHGPTRWHPITPTPTVLISSTPPPQTPTETPALHPGTPARVIARAGVRLRKTPGYKGKPPSDVLVVVPSGATVTVIGGPQEVDGLRWWRVRWRTFEGWMAEESPAGVPLLAPGNP